MFVQTAATIIVIKTNDFIFEFNFFNYFLKSEILIKNKI
jgi:hypothetical protein